MLYPQQMSWRWEDTLQRSAPGWIIGSTNKKWYFWQTINQDITRITRVQEALPPAGKRKKILLFFPDKKKKIEHTNSVLTVVLHNLSWGAGGKGRVPQDGRAYLIHGFFYIVEPVLKDLLEFIQCSFCYLLINDVHVSCACGNLCVGAGATNSQTKNTLFCQKVSELTCLNSVNLVQSGAN